MELYHRELSDTLPGERSPDALAAVANTPTPVAVASPTVPTLLQRPHASSPPPRPSTKQEKSISATRPSHKPRHVILDEGSIARRKATQVASTSTPKPAAPLIVPSPAKASHPTRQAGISTRKDAALIKSTSQSVASSSTPIGPFALSSGREVTFSQVAGHWEAVVKESWGTFSREITLPVLCKEEVSVALRKLEGEAALHTQRRIHILETHQPPWAPRVVYVGALGLRGGAFGSIGRVGQYTGKYYQTHIVASDWEGTCREWEAECQQRDRDYFREEASRQVKAYLQYKEYNLYETAFISVKAFKAKFSPYKDIIVKICVKAMQLTSKVKGTLVLLNRCDLPQNPSPLALIQAYIDRADCLMKRLANTGQTDYAWKTHGLEEVCFALQSPGEERISDSTRSSLRAKLRVIKGQLLSEERVASISARAYMNWVQECRNFEQRRIFEQEARRARLDETHRREEQRRRQEVNRKQEARRARLDETPPPRRGT